MYDLLLVLLLLVAICLIVLILIQQGKGATMGASFGSGASGTLFGSTGAGNFMTRSTGVLAALFFIISLALGNFASRTTHSSGDEWSNLGKQTVTTQPAATSTPDAASDAKTATVKQSSDKASSKQSITDASTKKVENKSTAANSGKANLETTANTKQEKSSK